MLSNFFKNKKSNNKNGKGFWFSNSVIKSYNKETGSSIKDENDPEYDAQKIYTHYLSKIGLKK